MKKHRFSLILTCLLLCGCADAPAPQFDGPSQEAAPSPVCSYAAGHPLEQRTRGGLNVYPLNIADATGLEILGESVLLFSGQEDTTLTLLEKEALREVAAVTLSAALSTEEPSLMIEEDSLSFFDPLRKETLVLDDDLRVTARIPAPPGLVGKPLLSGEGKLYYCDETALRVLDTHTDDRRCIRQLYQPYETISGLHTGGTVVACTGDGRTEYISAETGRLLGESRPLSLVTAAGRYYAAWPSGMTTTLLFGTGEEAPRALIPADLAADCLFLPAVQAAVTACFVTPEQLRLDYYDLTSGLRTSSVLLDTASAPVDMTWSDGFLYLLTGDALYRWDVAQTAVHDPKVYIGPHFTADIPDEEGLARCRNRADALEERFHIRILFGADAAGAAPPDVSFREEFLVPVIDYQLDVLEAALGRFPEGMLAATAAHFDSLTISLLRKIDGDSHTGGLRYFLGKRAFIALEAETEMERALYHNLFQVMESHLWSHSIALDQWESLNPQSFAYGQVSDQYLMPETRAFVDKASMVSAREDRARIMEFACTPGNQAYFQSEPMQRKLRTLCTGIRESYGLTEGPFFWEQYLLVPME